MSDLITCIMLYFAIIVFDLRFLIKKKEKRALYFYLPVLILTFAINALNGLNYKIPSPSQPIEDIVGKIFKVK